MLSDNSSATKSNSAENYLIKGKELYNRNQIEGAIENLNLSIDVNPKHIESFTLF